jgi:rhodanese-related sulfurtransferase
MTKAFEKAKERQSFLFNELAAQLNALASPVRLKILHFLTQGPHSVEQLSSKIDQSVANTSMHLKKMQREGLLKNETLAQKRIYSIAHPSLKTFWEEIQNLSLAHNPENIINSKDFYEESLEYPKSNEELLHLIKSRKLTLLDVRPEDEVHDIDLIYKKYVLHIPFSELKKQKHLLPTSRPVIVICRGRMCVMSHEVTSQLRKLGFDAYRINKSWFQLSNELQEV